MYRIANSTFECDFLTPLMREKSSFYLYNQNRDKEADIALDYSFDEIVECSRSHQHLELSQCEKIYSLKKMFDALIEKGKLIAHASVISVNNNGIVFFGSRNSGKSTQATIWKKCFESETVIISDDRPLLVRDSDSLYAWNTPWSDYQSGKHFHDYTEIRVACFIIKSNMDKAVRIKSDDLIERIGSDYPVEIRNKISPVLQSLLKDIPCFLLYNTADSHKLDLLRKELIA